MTYQTNRFDGAGMQHADMSNTHYADADPASVFLVLSGPSLNDCELALLERPGIMTAGVI